MKKVSIILLKFAVILLGLVALAIYIFIIPKIGNFAAELFPNIVYIKYLIFIVLYATVIPFYFALHQVFNLLIYIDKNKVFSKLSLKALKNIKISAIIISSIYVIGMPLFYLMGEVDDAPGIIVLGMIMIFISIVIAAFAFILQDLLRDIIADRKDTIV